MAKARAVARRLDHLAGRPVHLAAGDARSGGGNGGLLGGQDGLVHPAVLLIHRAHRHRPGHIRTVAVHQAAEVHGDKVPPFYRLAGGDAVGHGGVGAADHNVIEGGPLRPLAVAEI